MVKTIYHITERGKRLADDVLTNPKKYGVTKEVIDTLDEEIEKLANGKQIQEEAPDMTYA